MTYLYNACEAIDAAVFSSDMLFDDERRKMLKEYVARWDRAITSHEADEAQPPVEHLPADDTEGGAA